MISTGRENPAYPTQTILAVKRVNQITAREGAWTKKLANLVVSNTDDVPVNR